MRAFLAAAVAATLAAAITAAPRAAAAQAAAPQVAARTTIVAATDAVAGRAAGGAALVRPAATYRFARLAVTGLPAEVTVADSAGQLVASYRLDGDRAGRAMAVTVIDTSLVLQADTPSGLLTMLLDGQNASVPGPVTGRWWLGEARGALRPRTR